MLGGKGNTVSTPPICIAVRLPFVLQYASHLYCSTLGKILVVVVTGMLPTDTDVHVLSSATKDTNIFFWVARRDDHDEGQKKDVLNVFFAFSAPTQLNPAEFQRPMSVILQKMHLKCTSHMHLSRQTDEKNKKGRSSLDIRDPDAGKLHARRLFLLFYIRFGLGMYAHGDP